MSRKQTRAEDFGPYSAAAGSKEAIRARIALIGRERGIPQEEIDQALAADFDRDYAAILKFMEGRRISMHWLLTGDLQCLKLMRQPELTW